MDKQDSKNCVFCKIIAGAIPCSKVYEDAECLVFLDIQPINPGHLLVIPKKHAPTIAMLPEETGGHLFKIGMRANQWLRKSGIECEGVSYFLADGEAAGQEVFHSHLHVVPRFSEDGFGYKFSEKYFKKPSREELEATARKIAQAVTKP